MSNEEIIEMIIGNERIKEVLIEEFRKTILNGLADQYMRDAEGDK